MEQTTIFLTDPEQWTLETMNWPGTVKHCMWNLAGYYLLDWSSLKPIWENPPLISSLASSITGYHRQFQMCPGHLLQTSLNAAVPWAPKQQLLWFLGSSSEGFICSLSVAALQGNGDMWLSPLGPTHMMRLHLPWSNLLWRAGPVSIASAPTPFIPPSSSFVFISWAALAVTSAQSPAGFPFLIALRGLLQEPHLLLWGP